MKVSYNKLWKLLIDMNLNKTKLREMAQMSPNTMAKLGKMKQFPWISFENMRSLEM